MVVRLVATLLPRRPAEVAALLREPPAGTDWIELRLDALPRPEPGLVAELLALPRTAPVIATARAPAQGGLSPLDDDVRLALLAAAGEAGAELLDIEDTLLSRLPASVPGRRLASAHVSRFVPRLEALARRVLERGADFSKLAVPADTPRQLAELADLQERHAGELSLVVTGRLAEAGRVLLAGRGTPLVYGAASPEHRGHRDQPLASRLHDVHAVQLVNEATRFLAVAGRPVAHSLSPLFHDTVLRGMNRNLRLLPFELDRLTDLLAWTDHLRLDGLAVTHPFKLDALAEARSALPGAVASGGANTLLRTPAGWQARNTDWRAASELLPRLLDGWRRQQGAGGKGARVRAGGGAAWVDKAVAASWRRRAPGRRPGPRPVPRVLLLGAGGAARAIAVALADETLDLFVWARRPAAAEELADERPGALAVAQPLDEPCDLVVNATPVGMEGVDAGALAELDPGVFRPGGVALDLVYGAAGSPFRRAAERAGVPVVGGEIFFALQARRQAELFTGGEVPAELLDEAARRCGVPL